MVYIDFIDSETVASIAGTCETPTFPWPGGANDGLFACNNQVIVPTTNFSGCGVITDWTVVTTGGGASGFMQRQNPKTPASSP